MARKATNSVGSKVETKAAEQSEKKTDISVPNETSQKRLLSSGLVLKKAGDVAMSAMYLKILIHGLSGAGKTWFATSASNVAVCLLETQGFATIRDQHPHAIVPARESKDGIPVMQSMTDVREFVLMARHGVFKEAGIDTLVFDSGNELQQMMIDEILSGSKKKKDKDGKVKRKVTLTQQDWGTLAQTQRSFMRVLRDLPYHIVFVTLSDWYIDEESGKRQFAPLLKGSIQKEVMGYFHAGGYLYKRQVGGSVERFILLDGDDRFAVKPFSRLTGICVPDLARWLDVALNPDSKDEVRLPDAPFPVGSESNRKRGPSFGDDDDDKDDDTDEEEEEEE